MKLKLKRIAPLQAGKILAVFYGLFSLILVPFMLIAMSIASLSARQTGVQTPPVPMMLGMGMGFIVFMPVIYAAIGFVFGTISAWVYNVVAKWVGGFELEFEPPAPPVDPAAVI